MEKMVIFALMMLVLVSSVSAYGDYYRDVKISRAELIKNALLRLNANIDNEMGSRLRYTRLAMFIPELGLREATHFTVKRYGTQRLFMSLPSNIKPGVYVVRITASNDDFRRVKHREIVIP
jgi:hypothetical protein